MIYKKQGAFAVVSQRQPNNTFQVSNVSVVPLVDNCQFHADAWGAPLFGKGIITSLLDIDGQYVIILHRDDMLYNRIRVYPNRVTIDEVPELGFTLHCGIAEFNFTNDLRNKQEVKTQYENIADVVSKLTGLNIEIEY